MNTKKYQTLRKLLEEIDSLLKLSEQALPSESEILHQLIKNKLIQGYESLVINPLFQEEKESVIEHKAILPQPINPINTGNDINDRRRKLLEEAALKKEQEILAIPKSTENVTSDVINQTQKEEFHQIPELVKEEKQNKGFDNIENNKDILEGKPIHLQAPKPIEKIRPNIKEPAPIIEDLGKKEIQNTGASFQEKFESNAKEDTSINKKFSGDAKSNIADKLKSSKIQDINKALNLNQRIGLIKNLFRGNDEHFSIFISKINDSSNEEEAQNHLITERINRQWDENSIHLDILNDLVTRKHSL